MSRIIPRRTLLAGLTGLAVPARTASAQEPCGRLRITGSDEWRPFSFRDDGAELRGIGVEVAAEVGRRLGVEVVSGAGMSWNRALRAVETGEADILTAAYDTDERRIRFHLTPAYAADELRAFVVPGHGFPLSRREDLIGRRGIRPFGGSYGQEFDEFMARHLTVTETHTPDPVAFLAAGRADYLLLADRDGRATYAGRLTPLPLPLGTMPVHLLVSRTSACAALAPRIDAAIEAMRDDGTLARVMAGR